jgi:hypothetical protein
MGSLSSCVGVIHIGVASRQPSSSLVMTAELPPHWEKIKALVSLIAGIGIPLVLVLIANSFSKE